MIKFPKPQLKDLVVLNFLENTERPIEFLNLLKENKNIRSIFFDHWKSVEKINSNNIKNIPTFCLIHSKEINHEKNSGLNKRVLISLEKVKFIIANSNLQKD